MCVQCNRIILQVRSSQQNIGTGKRGHGRKSKTQKSESEEYDSLGSDTESGSGEHGIHSRKDLDENGPVNFSSKINQLPKLCGYVIFAFNLVPQLGHAHSPGSRSGKERLAVFSRPTHHSKLVLFCGIITTHKCIPIRVFIISHKHV